MTVVLAIPGNEDHATKLGARLGTAVITPEVRWFPDGEIYIRIDENLGGHDAVIVGSLYPAPAEKFLMTSFLAATARDLGARRVGLVAPYLAFMRQDVQFKPGEGVTSAYFGRLVSGAVEAIRRNGRNEIKVASIDGDRVGFQMLLDEDSPFVATVVQDVPRIGSLAAEVLMQRIAGKEDFPSTLFTDAWLATHANGVAAAEKRWGPGVWDALGIARKDVEARWPQNGELQVVHPILP